MSFDLRSSADRAALPNKLVRRSALILPVNVPKFVEKAHQCGADAIVLDLEDSVPAEEKSAARGMIPDALQTVGRGGVPVLVRVNRQFSELVRDLDACVRPLVSEVIYPKAESPDEVKILDALLRERELASGLVEGKIGINLLIESALGLEHAFHIAQASPRVVTIALGGEDLKRELNLDVGPDGDELLWGHSRIIVAARAAGVIPLGFPGSIAEYRDLEQLGHAVERGRRMGYAGAYCIHPRQVEVLNKGFSPADVQIAWAERVVEAFSLSIANGRASTSVDGAMVDVPIAEQARDILDRARRIRELDAQQHLGTRD